LEALVKTLTDKLDRADAGSHDQAAFGQLERQIMGLVEKVDAADQKFGSLGTIERGIQQLTLQVRAAREDAAATAERVARTVAAGPRPSAPVQAERGERVPIAPGLPADTPLEPGSAARGRTEAERIAASEAALGPLKREAGEVTGKANFIAAARRAAQAAANEG